mmetsp:Transcript_44469/g.87247  ORF Transcript_44469/g.87247 Transcript_44469/m.87247 type:complete len:417 (+) Transcript_44469:153-1403(+)|eukprot:CAMPEP_0194330248 /NCGR_PEP_ID=MMETSP0171-20130528/51183_1 /TAXON_ID=218684 /ORGANISM="Corethron pennatum, Strain L29A3" /LENGTH=416 /DNA_ID=CAMNT_0039091273 /DNA_START=61 /DNA_END=1311 /DNA_ORIENTATION=-
MLTTSEGPPFSSPSTPTSIISPGIRRHVLAAALLILAPADSAGSRTSNVVRRRGRATDIGGTRRRIQPPLQLLPTMSAIPSAVRHAAAFAWRPPVDGTRKLNRRRTASPSVAAQDIDGEAVDLQRQVGELKEQVQYLLRVNERLAAGGTAVSAGKYEERVEMIRDEARPRSPPRVIIETFEGGNYNGAWESSDVVRAEEAAFPFAEECEVMPDGTMGDGCPLEPNVPFRAALRDRAVWLVGLLAMQSCSGFILARNEQLLQMHPVIIYFLTMLVGAGGNAGNQASVRVIRGLAVGSLNKDTQANFIRREFKMAFALAAILSAAGFVRAICFATPFAESVAVTTSLTSIVFLSVCLGSVLPLGLKAINVDPAHASTSIQVIMDILGVFITVVVSIGMLDTTWGGWFIGALSNMFGNS